MSASWLGFIYLTLPEFSTWILMHLYPLGRRYLIPSQSLKSPSYSLFIEQSIYPRQGAGVHFRWAWLMVGATRNHTAHWHRRKWFALQSALISQSTQFDTPANGKYNTTSLLIRHQSLIFSQRTNLAHFHYRSYSKLKSLWLLSAFEKRCHLSLDPSTP